MLLKVACLLVLTAFTHSQIYAEVIIRRDGLANIEAKILSGGETGLLVNVDNTPGQSTRIPWSSIQSIEPLQSRPRMQSFIEEGKLLWRAKERLLRGDVHLAEPLFAKQFNRLLGTDGSDSRLAAEGLLRIYLAKGELGKAIHPWLETARLHESGIESPFSSFQSILDDKTMLCSHLPPFVLDPSYLQSSKHYASSTSKVSSIATTLLSTREQQLEQLVNLSQEQLFLVKVLLAKDGHPDAINQLNSQLDGMSQWQQAWAHYSIAVGLLQTEQKNQRNNALLHLANVCALDPSTQPWLTGAAMLRLSKELDSDALSQQAQRVRQEAIRLYPSHPLLLGETK